MSAVILVDKAADGSPKYYAETTAIGPRSTPNRDEAMRFGNRFEAASSPAFKHWSANWTVEDAEGQ